MLLAGGTTHDSFMDATVLDHVTPGMRLYREESFGPVAALIRAQSLDEAVTIANDCQYGLSASVFGRDIGQAIAVARRIESRHMPRQRRDRHGRSPGPLRWGQGQGYGRFGGQQAVDAFYRAPLDHRQSAPPALSDLGRVRLQFDTFMPETTRGHQNMDIKQIINGKPVGAISGKTFVRHDPFTGAVASTAPASGVEDVTAVAAAAAAFPAWAKIGPGARRALLPRPPT